MKNSNGKPDEKRNMERWKQSFYDNENIVEIAEEE